MSALTGLAPTRNRTCIPGVTEVASQDLNDLQDVVVAFANTSYGILGNGADGSVNFDGVTIPPFATLGGGVYTLTRGTALINAKFSPGIRLNMNGHPFCGIGMLTTTDVGQIFCTGGNGGVGLNSGGVGGTAGAAGPAGSLSGGSAGGAGGVGTVGSASAAITAGFGGRGGTGGASTTLTGGAGGTVTAPPASLGNPNSLRSAGGFMLGIATGVAAVTPKYSGSGGGGGGGASFAYGGGGGGSAGTAVVAFAFLNLAHANDIQCTGGAGGAGASGVGPSSNGGGGGAGGGGGVLDIIYNRKAAGLVFSGAVNCPGGAGGAGGPAGVGFTAGTAGAAGAAGVVYEFALQPPISASAPANVPSFVPSVYLSTALPDPSTFPRNSVIVTSDTFQLLITFDNVNWQALS